MNNEEALQILSERDRIRVNIINANDAETTKYNNDSVEALSMAIAALKAEPCGDAVSLDSVIDTIEWYRTNPQHFTEDNLIEDIKGLPPVTPKQKWIPVSERLPEEDGEYLLWGKICEDDENNYCFIGEYDSCAEKFGDWREYHDSSTLGFLDSELIEYHKVLAWMPLPEPYKEGESE